MTAETHMGLGVSFELPLRGSNEDHLEIFEEAGTKYGLVVGEKTAANIRLAARARVATVSEFATQLKTFGFAADAAVVAVKVGRFALPPQTTVRRYLITDIRADLELMCANLKRDYRANQIARFRVSAWRKFKLVVRESENARAH